MTGEDLAALVRDCSSLSRCEECGSVVAKLGSHTCPTGESTNGKLTRREREQLADGDGRDDDDLVGIYRRAQGGTYAYHELDGSVPVCGCQSYTKARRFDRVTRAEAKRLGRSPCGTCRRVLE